MGLVCRELLTGYSQACCRPDSALTFVVAAALAGGICGQFRVEINVVDSLVVGNAAPGNDGGGGIYLAMDSTLRVANTAVEKNNVITKGGEQAALFRELLTHIMCWSPQSCHDMMYVLPIVQAGFAG